MSATSSCPCGSAKPFENCCLPYLRGDKPAPDAKTLMRSRYAAYTTQDTHYLLRSWHPDTRPDSIAVDPDIQWQRLKIISTSQDTNDAQSASVEFIAHYKLHGRAGQLHETSRFRKIAEHWYYLDGELHDSDAAASKISRNARCPCGSGKKYKRCCGQ